MMDIRPRSDDVIIIDKDEHALHGDIVIAEIDSKLTVKYRLLTPRPILQADTNTQDTPGQRHIFGIITAIQPH